MTRYHGLKRKIDLSVLRVPCFNSLDMIRPISTVAFESVRSVPVHRNVLINVISSLEILEQYDWNTEKRIAMEVSQSTNITT